MNPLAKFGRWFAADTGGWPTLILIAGVVLLAVVVAIL